MTRKKANPRTRIWKHVKCCTYKFHLAIKRGGDWYWWSTLFPGWKMVAHINPDSKPAEFRPATPAELARYRQIMRKQRSGR